jgi:hypothetical protein
MRPRRARASFATGRKQLMGLSMDVGTEYAAMIKSKYSPAVTAW